MCTFHLSYKKRDLHTQTTGWWTSSLEFILENISLEQDVSHIYVFFIQIQIVFYNPNTESIVCNHIKKSKRRHSMNLRRVFYTYRTSCEEENVTSCYVYLQDVIS